MASRTILQMTDMLTHRVSTIRRGVVLGLIVATMLCGHACTKKVVGHRGIYSPQQLPEETNSPILDALGNAFGGESDKPSR